MKFGPLNDGSNKHRLEANVVGTGTGLDRDERDDDQGHVAQEEPDRSDPVLRRQRQAGHADRRPDVRPGPPDRVEGDDHAGRPAAPAGSPLALQRRRLAVGRAVQSAGVGAAAAAYTARVSRATSAQVRGSPAARSRAASARRRVDPVVEERRLERRRQPSGVARLDEDPGGTRRSRAAPRPSRRRPERRTAIASIAGSPALSERTGSNAARAPRTSAASRSSSSRGAYTRASPTSSRAAARASAARSSGVAPAKSTRGGHGSSAASPAGPAGVGQLPERAEQRAEVLAGVVPAGVDDVARRQPQAVALGARVRGAARAGSRRGDRRRERPAPSSRRDGTRPAARAESTWIRSRRTRSSRRAARPVASVPTMTAAASRSSRPRSRCPNRAARPRWYAPGSSHGARSSSVTTSGSPVASGIEPPAAW